MMINNFIFAPVTLLLIFTNKISILNADVQCEDHESTCDDFSTCCLMQSGEYGCCPLPNAVCCSDQIHCCPQNTACDLKQLQCIKNVGDYQRLLPISKKVDARRRKNLKISIQASIETELSDVTCPGGQSTCPSNCTCCPIDSQSSSPNNDPELNSQVQQHFGCCPYVNAVCCPDKQHCCPSGTTCNSEYRRCLYTNKIFGTTVSDKAEFSSQATSTPWAKKFAASENSGTIVCGDKKSKCPDGTTCCKLVSGQWGCCPMPQAICCSDGIHCCPQDTVCDVQEGRCVQRQTAVVEKLVHIKSEFTVTCSPEGTYSCPDGTTCCKLKSGKWGCCPMPLAVCCKDGEHCCPHNTKCDVTQGRCVDNDIRRYFSLASGTNTKTRMKKVSITAANTNQRSDSTKLCPDQKQECQIDQTCCLYNDTNWTCCPFPQAVCCPNANPPYCCAHGQKCGTSGQSCQTKSRNLTD